MVGGAFTFSSSTASDYCRLNYGNGDTFFKCFGDFNLTNSGKSAGQGFTGIYRGTGDFVDSIVGSYLQTDGQFVGIYTDVAKATGDFVFDTKGSSNFIMNGGIFRGISNDKQENSSSIIFSTYGLTFNKGCFIGYYGG